MSTQETVWDWDTCEYIDTPIKPKPRKLTKKQQIAALKVQLGIWQASLDKLKLRGNKLDYFLKRRRKHE